MQQQRLTDLKKTLQKELKVQSLPNDEPSTNHEALKAASVPTNNLPATPRVVTQAVVPPTTTPRPTTRPTQPDGMLDHRRTSRGSSSSVPGEELIHDVNFQYLKHVVLKFMLSRDHEVNIKHLKYITT